MIAIYTTSRRDERLETKVIAFVGERQPDVFGMPNDTPVQLWLEKVITGEQRLIEAMQIQTITMT
jgi:hypothetical protein